MSAAIAFTETGEDVLKQSNCTLIEYPFEVVAEGQMKTVPLMTQKYRIMMRLLKTSLSIKTTKRILDIYDKFYRHLLK